MFSTGQILFALIFTVIFATVITQAYRKDRKLHRRNYGGVQWIAIFFVGFVIILFFIKYMLKN
jgi:uncharacterized membrane protein